MEKGIGYNIGGKISTLAKKGALSAPVLGMIAVVGCADNQDRYTTTPYQPTPSATPYIPEATIYLDQDFSVRLGEPEKIKIPGIRWYPDGHVSFIREGENIKVFISGGPKGYLIQGTDIKNLNSVPQELIGPSDEETFDRDYAAPGSIIKGSNNELLMFYHGEYHPNKPENFLFNAGIGLAVSTDGGTTWEKKGQIIKGKNNQKAVDRVYGAGQPSAIVKDDYIYLYYTDWNGQDPDAIHLARSPLKSNGSPESWEKLYNGEFKNQGIDGPSSPVILPPQGGNYAGVPGISFNTYLQEYLMVFEAREGFYLSTSKDGVNWSLPKSLLKVKTANDNTNIGEVWNSYPTLLSDGPKNSAPNDQETDRRMKLVYSEGKWGLGFHSMVVRDITLD